MKRPPHLFIEGRFGSDDCAFCLDAQLNSSTGDPIYCHRPRREHPASEAEAMTPPASRWIEEAKELAAVLFDGLAVFHAGSEQLCRDFADRYFIPKLAELFAEFHHFAGKPGDPGYEELVKENDRLHRDLASAHSAGLAEAWTEAAKMVRKWADSELTLDRLIDTMETRAAAQSKAQPSPTEPRP